MASPNPASPALPQYSLKELLSAPVEERLTLAELARQERKSPPTAWRWGQKGVKGLRLPTFLLGNTRVTTQSAYHWWLEQLTLLAERGRDESRTTRQCEKAVNIAERALKEFGV